ncbi:MAG: hypothetical protein F4110_14115 [Acidimicrobiaceae bacterium]|nr:hypothetical protein [Acidimicrobiaceae bacterium]MXZ99981.1 hypothetical protein [Acidimicrobiaceae bacterium]MYE75479.1 hypothetical protein [Acidimicrobiaceae bacterium]MYE97305.1 hypothetical protein [Acidimicrobiaceae bacterium]MYH42741.1 hypothetical protein [Acidimicrobiaceae bacterium]
MDEAVALVLAAPVVALALWAVAFVGGFANGQARAAVAAELAAQAAAQAGAPEAAESAERVALGATLSACVQTSATLVHADASQSATVTVVCEASGPPAGNRVCVTGYAQSRPAASAHVRVACPASQ